MPGTPAACWSLKCSSCNVNVEWSWSCYSDCLQGWTLHTAVTGLVVDSSQYDFNGHFHTHMRDVMCACAGASGLYYMLCTGCIGASCTSMLTPALECDAAEGIMQVPGNTSGRCY